MGGQYLHYNVCVYMCVCVEGGWGVNTCITMFVCVCVCVEGGGSIPAVQCLCVCVEGCVWGVH